MPDISKMLHDAQVWRAKANAKTSRGERWFTVSNATEERATIRIYDEISFWGVDAQSFATELDGIRASEIEVAINSPGGSVFDGLAIFNALRLHPAKIITRVDGLAASAASFIAQAGDERVMVDSSQMMIHEAWGVAAGNAGEMRDFADFLEQQSANIAELYATRSTTQDAAYYADLMSAETWLSASQAVDAGLADRVLTPQRIASEDASNKFSTETPDISPALAAGESPAVDVAQHHRRDHALVSHLALLTDAERTDNNV